jgi:hypothetical protein
VAQAVKSTPGSTSVIGFAYYAGNKSGLSELQLDGVVPRSKTSPMAPTSCRPLATCTKGEPTGLTKAFLDFFMSKQVQVDIAAASHAPGVASPPMPRPPVSPAASPRAARLPCSLWWRLRVRHIRRHAQVRPSTFGVVDRAPEPGRRGRLQIGNSDVTAEEKLATPDMQSLVNHDVVKQGWIMVTSPDVGPTPWSRPLACGRVPGAAGDPLRSACAGPDRLSFR